MRQKIEAEYKGHIVEVEYEIGTEDTTDYSQDTPDNFGWDEELTHQCVIFIDNTMVHSFADELPISSDDAIREINYLIEFVFSGKVEELPWYSDIFDIDRHKILSIIRNRKINKLLNSN